MIFLRINKKYFNAFTGIAVGICNGFFGSGGGMIAVPMLEKGGSEAKKAHATSIAITLPLSVISGLIYFKGGSLDIWQAVKFIPEMCIRDRVGAMLMKKLSNSLLKRIFGLLMIIAGVRIFMK